MGGPPGVGGDPMSLDWHERARCHDTRTPELFAPQWGSNGRLPEEAFLVAHLYCRPCPVRAQCDAQRVAEGEGAAGLIWAGQLVTQKSQDRRRLRVHDLLSGERAA